MCLKYNLLLIVFALFVAVPLCGHSFAAQQVEGPQALETTNPSSDVISTDTVAKETPQRPLIDPPWWVYLLSFVAIIGVLVWTYLRKRWIRIGLIGTMITGLVSIPGMHFVIKPLGVDITFWEVDWAVALVAGIAVIALAVL